MWLISLFLILVMMISLWIALSPREIPEDDHIGMRYADTTGPGLFVALVCLLALIAING